MSVWTLFLGCAFFSFLYYSSFKDTRTEAYFTLWWNIGWPYHHLQCPSVLENGWDKVRLTWIVCIHCILVQIPWSQDKYFHFHNLTAGGFRLILCSQVGNVNLVNLTMTARRENHDTKSLIIQYCWRSYTASGANSCSHTYTLVRCWRKDCFDTFYAN